MSSETQAGRGTVLVVDDEPAITGLVATALERAGYRVIEANDGESGVARARADRPSLILMDITMPGVDGYAAAQQLVDDPLTARIPILFLTGKTMQEDGGRAFKHGGAMFVRKPFSPARIVELVDVAMLSLK